MSQFSSSRVGVVGGGLAGLTAACTLAGRGHDVILLERNAWVGGKAAVLEQDGYRFDMGPTILTLPSVLARVFGEADRSMEDYLELIPLDPQWRCFFEDGSILDLHSDVERMQKTLDEFSPETNAAQGYRRFLEFAERLHRISDKYFFWRSLGSMKDMFNLKQSFEPGTLADVLQMKMGRTVAGAIRSYVSDERVAQMLDHFTQYVGSAPDQSPAVLCGIAHMQTEEGVWYPRGGTGAVPRALRQLAEDLGVETRTGVQVREIVTTAGRVSGVVTEDGERIPLDAVVSNRDAVLTYRDLLPRSVGERFERKNDYEAACSGVVLYLGLDRRYEHLLHHNFVFSEDPHAEFEAIYRQGEPASDPTCYVCAPSSSEPEVAPAGGEALYVLVHTPYLRAGHDWRRMAPEYRQVIVEKLRRTAGMEDIEERIVFERTLTPEDIRDRYQVLDGAIYGLASHGRFSGAFKPANRSPEVDGLYLAGGAAHPGPGMPMVMMSGWIAADSLDQDRPAVASATSGSKQPEATWSKAS